MSFGGGFGSTGFGSNNNQNTSSGFGGFGSGTTNTGGFGSNQNTTSGFGGSSNTGGSIFGSGGGFGSTSNNAFGQNKTAFGSTGTTGGGLFGSTSNTGSGFGSGGFGTTNTTSAFGGSGTTTGGGLFGNTANKPAFGAPSTTGGIFGSNNNNNTTTTTTTTSSFGGNTGGTLFGNQSASAFGNVQECQGTGGQTFQAFQEKENNSLVTNHFQSITFMQPFQKYSFEELRLADYARGQKQGNANGQAGAFGASTGFGSGFGNNTTNNTTSSGFGSANTTGGGLFGNTTTSSSSGFGANTATSGGFGSTGGGLFGNQSKPATGGLFGNTTTNTTSSGGLFGNSNPSSFGQQSNATGGGLFGNNNNNNAAKPGGLFGGTTTNSGGGLFGGGSGGGFGTANSTSTSGGGLFGNNANNQASGGFGNAQQSSNPFGSQNNTASNPFGQNQQKPAGLFGNQPTNQSGGLFGNTNNQQASGGLFGNQQQQQQTQSSSLFGNNQNKGGLFGGSTNGGLFGNNQQQQQTTGGLFGNNQQTQQQPSGGLFGNNQQQNPGSTLFGNNQQTQATSGLFGANQSSLNNQQPQQNPLEGRAGFAYAASIHDPSPFGSASIFHGLPPPPQNSPGPVATPIASGSVRAKKPAALPQYKLNPAVASRLMTPQKRGYGFSYSTYGTPSSATSTPGGLGSSLMGGSLGRSLGKSLSTSNLRSDGEPTSILAPGAFSASSQRYSATGSLKRLTIDRTLRTDLFNNSPPPAALPPATSSKAIDDLRGSALKKKVSFDTTPQIEANSQPIERQSATPSAQEQGYLRSSTTVNGSKSAQTSADDTLEPAIQGNELAIVPEDNSPEATRGKPTNLFEQSDPQPGDYWIEPSIDDLKKLSTAELKAVRGFKIGRENCGFVEFNEPVDLTTIDVENIPDAIAIINLRSLTVYPENAYKPPVGKGLNVPATITLENSWPRARDRRSPSYEKSGPRFTKHVERLKRVPDTEFVEYNKDTGEWTFRVPHFTTYGLEYDDEDESMVPERGLDESIVSQAPPTPTPQGKKVRGNPKPVTEEQPRSFAISSVPSEEMSVDVDTSAAGSALAKRGSGAKRTRTIPGGFEDGTSDEGEVEDEIVEMMETGLGGFPTRSASPDSDVTEEEPQEFGQLLHEPTQPVNLIGEEDLTMAGSFPDMEQDSDEDLSRFSAVGTPMKMIPDLNDDWADRLQQTVSPRKQDRQRLKQSQAILDRSDGDFDVDTTPTGQKNSKHIQNEFGDIKTSVDLMRSLFGKEQLRRSGSKGNKTGFQWPYNKQETDADKSAMNSSESAFHQSFKPSFSAGNRVILRKDDSNVLQKPVLIASADRGHLDLNRLMKQTKILTKNEVPAAELRPIAFRQVQAIRPASSQQEYYAYELLAILFDTDTNDAISQGIPEAEQPQYAHRIRKDRLSSFWARLCEPAATEAVKSAQSAEERAFAYLSMNKIAEACEALAVGKDYRLATLVAQIGGDEVQRQVMRQQMEAWSKLNTLSEFDDAVRALYTLMTGETVFCEPKQARTEDRVKGFNMSERFGLDWVRCFGLKLWYGILPNESLETAVNAFATDLASLREKVSPDPSVLRSHSTASWRDHHPDDRQDMLWSLLKLAAEKNQIAAKTKTPEAISPENISGNPTSFRLSFELHQMIAPRLPRAVDPVKADALTIAFSSELESLGDWKYAIFVLMFIDDPQQRGRALQTSLARIAPAIDASSDDNLDFLFNVLRVPQSWFWNAKALESRAAGSKTREAVFLARGHNWVESHRVICEDVAPLAIIERDHVRLKQILDNFPQKSIAEWRLGGQVFSDYLTILGGKLGSPEQSAVLKNLLVALAELKPQPGDRKKLTFAQSVALGEMSKVAAQKARKLDDNDAVHLAGLPSTEEVQRQEMMNLGMQYFKATMARAN